MKNRQPDYPLIILSFILVFLGLVILSNASMVISQDSFGQSYHFLFHQLVFSLPLGLLAFFIFQKIPYHYLQKLSFPFLIITIILLALVFAPGLSYANDGVRRWLSIGSFSFQPFEITKLAFIIYLTALLGRKNLDEEGAIKKSFFPAMAAFGAIGLLVIAQPNLSALLILSVIAGGIYFLAGTRISYLLVLVVVIMIILGVLARTAPYRMERLTVFLHPELDPQGIGYQTNQALLAIGSGGFFGLGLTHSIQKWKYLPEVIGDSIFAIAAEELGLIGAGMIILLFLLFSWRGLKIAAQAPDRFGFLLAGGIVVWIFFQAFINMGAISGILPLTGMPLPFISYGGSSLIAVLGGVGILVNISKQT